MWGWVIYCFRNYAVFKDRAARPEYWWFYAFSMVTNLSMTYIVAPIFPSIGAIKYLWSAGLALPAFAVNSRRLHDTGHSFWWAIALFLVFIPIVVVELTNPALRTPGAALPVIILLLAFLGLALWQLILCCRKGDAGPNRFGDPTPTLPA